MNVIPKTVNNVGIHNIIGPHSTIKGFSQWINQKLQECYDLLVRKKHVQKHHKIYGFIQLTSDLIFSVYIEVWPFSNRIVNPF